MKHVLFPAAVGLAMVGLAACLPNLEAQHRAQHDACVVLIPHHLVGHPVTSLDGVALPEIVQISRPGDQVLTDIRPGRLNVDLDENDLIEYLSCG